MDRNTKIIDTHCHPQFPQFEQDRDEVIRTALEAGISMVCVGTDLETSRQAIALAGRYEGLYASVGLHPNDYLDERYEGAAYAELAKHPKVVAIGEVGLDYFRTAEPEKRAFQKERFIAQFELAQTMNKPLIIHCRDAHDDMISILDEQQRTHGSHIKSVIHSFNGDAETAKRYIDRGLYIGLNGIVTFSPQYEVMVRSLPLDRILLETDAPYLAPAPYRGKRNQPLYVDIIGRFIADIRNEDAALVFAGALKNSQELFSI